METLQNMMIDKFRDVKRILELKEDEWKIYNEIKYGQKSDSRCFHLYKCINALVTLESALNFAEKYLELAGETTKRG